MSSTSTPCPAERWTDPHGHAMAHMSSLEHMPADLSLWVCAGPIVSLSLVGPCVMELRRGGVHRPLHLPPRSLLVLAGEARLAWHHYIPHRRADTIAGRRIPRAHRRVSFTFRRVLFLFMGLSTYRQFIWSIMVCSEQLPAPQCLSSLCAATGI